MEKRSGLRGKSSTETEYVLFSWGCSNELPQVGGSDNRSLLSHSFEGHTSKVKLLAGLVPPEDVRENLLHASLLAFGGLLEIFDVHQLWQQNSILHMVFSLCLWLYVKFFFF